MANSVNSGSYAQFELFDEISYNCYKYLMEHNQMIWKLINYTDADAWKKPDLTDAEKAALIYNGNDDLTLARAFLDIGQPDVWTKEICIIRISPHTLFPTNRVIGTATVIFEVFCNYKINHLSNYKVRTDVIAKNFLQTFNGIDIGGVGKLYFDRMGSYDNRLEAGGQLPFKGRWLLMSNAIK